MLLCSDHAPFIKWDCSKCMAAEMQLRAERNKAEKTAQPPTREGGRVNIYIVQALLLLWTTFLFGVAYLYWQKYKP